MVEEASFVMSSFRPGVEEIDVETVYRIVRNEIGYKRGGVNADYPDICQCPSAYAVDGVTVVFAGAFDAEEIDVGMCDSFFEQEGGFTSSDFDVDGAGTSENADKIDFVVQVFGA